MLTLALNTAEPLLAGHYERACLDTVAPLLLLGWGRVGPAFLAQFHSARHPAPQPETTPNLTPVRAAVPVPAVTASAVTNPNAEPVLATAPTPTVVPAAIKAPETAPTPNAEPDPLATRPVTISRPALPAALLDAARRIADTHHAQHGTRITAPQLGTRMGIALPVATAALAQL
ncbi:hypothetical protein [Streptomyces globosus]|uniref:hypothetical protein n=1 Tax=Streptomyces globosus TaxID=68209 RepID=UPI0031DB1D16